MSGARLPAGFSGVRQQVTWIRDAGRLGRMRITHPWQVLVTDPEGTERAYDNWAQAAADSAERAGTEQP